ncbi:APC family permease [Anaeromyxobacter paludicola]|uniref:Amino acid transporter n=1 Tax=Anaeromyxobacter paludicola TaxID=2918171 RepID=A0ABM7XAI9_9BACT|nr:APC family permease [Anaeromyxobacter paludicola]BDG08868.1 amino acid transporter [Anaeromyxobacter paludicola]
MPPRLKHLLFGAPRDVSDPKTYHHISLVAFLAWVGLGADGLSSSSYGPDESFRALGQHHYLAVGLALATAFTVFIISYAYSRIVEHFPFGGGGYVVASKLLGPRFGVVSGSALLVDYVLTISTSIAAAADATFSFLPPQWHWAKLPIEFGAIALLMLLNLRGIKESVTALAPIFVVFLVTHVLLIGGALFLRAGELPAVAGEVRHGFSSGLATLGLGGMAALFLRAYSMGAGTYTGIEAVSNGLQIMREPKVQTAQRTMVLMALSLALTAGGITLGYLLVHASPVEGKTMNAVLVERLTGGWGTPGQAFVWLTLAAETALLFVAAQAGFIDGPRVMANMANDRWLPRRFALLSDRLSMQDGIVLISACSALTLLYTRGDTSTLVLMYSINVFLTFSLSELGMVRYWIRERARYPDWKRHILIHLIGLVLCLSILVVSILEKFAVGGSITLVVTSLLIGLCLLIRRHYESVQHNLRRLDEVMEALPAFPAREEQPLDPRQPTAVLLVGGYGGLGIHQLLSVQRVFPNQYRQVLFVSVGVIDSASMKGVEEVEEVRRRTEESLQRYAGLARRLGMTAGWRMSVGVEAVGEAESLCVAIAGEFHRAVFFAGKLIFERERWYQRLLHNDTAYELQRRLQFAGLNAVVLPVRILQQEPVTAAGAGARAAPPEPAGAARG